MLCWPWGVTNKWVVTFKGGCYYSASMVALRNGVVIVR